MVNSKYRKELTRVRTSAHSLAVETGRYLRPKPPRELRVCKLCKQNKVEDEVHFLTDCSLYVTKRSALYTTINANCHNFDHLNPYEKAQYMLTAEGEIVKAVAKFCYEANQIRKECQEKQ